MVHPQAFSPTFTSRFLLICSIVCASGILTEHDHDFKETDLVSDDTIITNAEASLRAPEELSGYVSSNEQSLIERRNNSQCRCFPGDTCWPPFDEWRQFNESLGGKLVATVPLGSPCHDDSFGPFNESACRIIQDKYLEPQTHYADSASVMVPFFANRSCDPFQPRTAQCVLGTYVQYAVNVSQPDDVSATIHFAQKRNIRLVIRNTGHDYNGKSTGAGAIGLWLHHLKNISITDYISSSYTGKAIKMGAGVQGFEAYEAAHRQGLLVIGGECPSVGLAGGYTQGAGHSSLASKYGLAADQALEWEVIDGQGRYLRANLNENQDLFWALSGGGGGTYGVVISLTAKAHPDMPVSGANLTFSSDQISQDQYYDIISTFHASVPPMVDAGVMLVWYFTNETFTINPATGPGVSASQLDAFLGPLLSRLDQLNVSYDKLLQQYPSYLDQYNAIPAPIDVGTAQYGGRLIPRSVVEERNEDLTAVARYINSQGGGFTGVGVNVSRQVAGGVDNAVHPAWRDTLIDSVVTVPWSFTAPWEELLTYQDKMTNDFIPRLAALTPNGGCYLNEGDFRQPDWKSVFYGPNYDRLLQIKMKYDPLHTFYATTAVGSDYWSVQEDGRLCNT